MKYQTFQQVLPKELRSQLINLREKQVLIRSLWRNGDRATASINCSSGFLISQSLILTSAHNIYSSDLQRPASHLVVFFNSSTNVITHNSQRVKIATKLGDNLMFMSGEKGYIYDMALVKLPQAKVHTPHIPVNMIKDLSVRHSQTIYAYISGYPDLEVKDCRSFKQSLPHKGLGVQAVLKEDIAPICEIDQGHAFYSPVSTLPGQSGGPVFTIIHSKLYIMGIHSQYASLTKTGKAVFFSDKMKAQLNKMASTLQQSLSKSIFIDQGSRINQEKVPYQQRILQPIQKLKTLQPIEQLEFPQQSNYFLSGQLYDEIEQLYYSSSLNQNLKTSYLFSWYGL